MAVGISVPLYRIQLFTSKFGQDNNVLPYPGLGLGVIISGAKHVTDAMLPAASEAVASQEKPQDLGPALIPPIGNLPPLLPRRINCEKAA